MQKSIFLTFNKLFRTINLTGKVLKQQSSPKPGKGLKKLNFFSRVMFFLNLIAALFTFISYFFVQISPKDFWIAGFFTLSLPVLLLVVHPVFIIYWLVNRFFLKILISLITLLAGYPLLQRTITFHETENIPFGKKKF